LLAPLYERDLPVFGKFFSAYLNGQTQLVKLFHNQSSGENATALDLTISGLSMKANLDGIQTQLIRQIDVLNFGIEFDPNDVNKVYVTGRLSVLFELPSNVNMTLKALTLSIHFVMRFIDGPAMGRIILHDLPVQHNQTTNELLMSFEKQELLVLNTTAFEEFAAKLVLTTNVSVIIEGLASALAQVLIGNITLTNIPVNDTLQLVGYNQFANGLLRIDDIDLAGAISSNALALQVKTEIINPSVVNIIYGGRLLLDLCDTLMERSFGLVNIDPFFLDPQGNATIIDAKGIFNVTDHNEVIAKQFISNMVSGLENEVELRGRLDDNSTGTSIPFLSLAIAGLRIHTKVPGLSGDKALVRELRLKRLTALEIAGITVGLVKRLSARIRLTNPFNTSMTIHGMDVKVDYGAKIDDAFQVGLFHDNTPLNIGARQELITPYLNVTIAAKLSTLTTMIGPLLAGHAHLSFYGFINITIGDEFVMNQIPITILNVTTDQEPAY
jgi:hypothetical protein